MNKEQKAAVVDEVAAQIQEADAIFAIDYRGLSVTQAVELRGRLGDAQASFRVVKNRLTQRAADKAGAESLKELLEGPTAFTFVGPGGDAALAAKAIATFRRERGLLEFKGGTMSGETLSVEEIESIARLPARDVLQGQFVGVVSSPLTGLVRGLGSLISGLALQLGQLQEQMADGAEQMADGGGQMAGEDSGSDDDSDGSDSEAPGDPVAEAEAEEETSEAPGASTEGGDDAADQAETKEG